MRKKLNLVLSGVVKILKTKQYNVKRNNNGTRCYHFTNNLYIDNYNNCYAIFIKSERGYSGLKCSFFIDTKTFDIEYHGVKPNEYILHENLTFCYTEEEFFMNSTLFDYSELISMNDMLTIKDFLLGLEKKKRYGKI